MDYTELVETLRQRRCAKKWSIQGLGHRLHLGKVTVGMYERGQRVPSTERFIEWANELDLDVVLLPRK